MLIDSQRLASQSLPITQEQRLKLLEYVLSFSTGDKSSLIQLLSLKPRLILPQDISWLIEYLLRAETEQQQRNATYILYYAINWHDNEQMHMVRKACEQNAILANEFASAPTTSEANTAQETTDDGNDVSDACTAITLTEEMASFLEQDNALQKKWIQCWIKAANLTYPSLNGALIDQNALFPGWNIIAKPIQTQLFDLAEQYIRECDPKSQEWIETQQMPLSVWITYKTLQLFIQHEKTESLLVLPTGQWQKLAPVVLVLSRPEDLSIDDELMKITSTKAVDTLTQNTLLLVDSIGKHSTDISVVDKTSRYWNTTIEKAFLSKVQETSLNLNGFFGLLRVLLIHHAEEAIAFAHSLLSTDISNEKQCEQVILATCALLLYADHLDWPLIRSAMDQNESYARKLLQKLAHKTPVPQQLSVDEIADLYIQLVRYYPPIHYPLPQGTDFAGAVDSIALWRNALISFLKEQGTHQACAAIERIINEGSDTEQFSLKWILREAQQLTRWQTWEPFAPRDILKMVQDSHTRLVQNGDHLLDIVIESLQRLEKALCYEETPAWRNVWDLMLFIICPQCGKEIKRSDYKKSKMCPQCQNRIKSAALVYRPIEENEFSNYIKKHLTADLRGRQIIANREVVISNEDRTDIYIEAWRNALPGEANDKVSVIVEVKGCWNKEWQGAMEEQLVKRYLKKYSCQHGIYLLGWFMCSSWDASDSRYQATPKKKSMQQVREQLEKQAEELSQQGRHVKAVVINATIP